jgi:hypothetical protein
MKTIESLEREGGHILICCLLFLYCMAVLAWQPDNPLAAKAGDMFLGALLMAMKGNQPKPPQA